MLFIVIIITYRPVRRSSNYAILVSMDKEIIARIKNTRLFALDMDGTVYLGRRWIQGAREFLARVRDSGREYVFVTNNSSRSAAQYLEKLADMGLAAEPRQIMTSGMATVSYLNEHFFKQPVCLLGTPALAAEFAAGGIKLADNGVAVAAFDTSLDYDKLAHFCTLVRGGAPYIATHPDINCPTESGYIPDCGAIAALVRASTGREPDYIVGKPHGDMFAVAAARFGVPIAQTAAVGDRLYTDIAAGNDAGALSLLVFSGEAQPGDLAGSSILPDACFDSVAEITPLL